MSERRQFGQDRGNEDRENSRRALDLFQKASAVGHRGVIQGGGSSFYNTFVGTYGQEGNKAKVTVELHTTPGYDFVWINGAGIQASINRNMWDREREYSASGTIPENIDEILANLEPDREAMKELDEQYRSQYRYKAKSTR